MKALFSILLAVSAFFLGGCAHHAWQDQPTYEMSVRWHRESGQAFVDAQGVCNVYMIASSQGIMIPLERQIKLCHDKVGHRFAVKESTDEVKNIKFYRTDGVRESEGRFADIRGMATYKAAVRDRPAICGLRESACRYIHGFYFPGSGYTGIVFTGTDDSVLPHELAHVWLGAYHDQNNRWWSEKK